jgi:hypothetical protein
MTGPNYGGKERNLQVTYEISTSGRGKNLIFLKKHIKHFIQFEDSIDFEKL